MRAKLWAVLAGVVMALASCSSDDDGDGGGTAAGGSGGDPEASSSTVPSGPVPVETAAEGSLTACLDVPNVPYAFEEGGQVVGVDADLVRALGGRLALTAAFVDVDAAGLYGALAEGRCDLVAAAVPIGTDLPDGLALTQAYLPVEQSLLVRGADQDSYPDLASLRGRRIGVRSGTAGAAFARANATDATAVDFTTSAELFAALEGNQIDAVVDDFPANAHHATTTGRTAVVANFPQAEKRQLALVVPDADPAFVQAVNGAIAQVTADDTFPTVLRRYLGTAPGPP